MVVGGSGAYSKVELLDVSGKNLTCPPIADFPVELGSFGTFINNSILVCGGFTRSSMYYSEKCYTYNKEVSGLDIIYISLSKLFLFLIKLYFWSNLFLLLAIALSNLLLLIILLSNLFLLLIFLCRTCSYY